MDDVSGGNFSMDNYTLSQQDCDFKNGLLNSLTFYQFEDSSTFKETIGGVEKCDGDVSCGYVFKYSHTLS